MRLLRGFLSCLLLLLAAGCDADPEPRTREQFCRDWSAGACSEEVIANCQAHSAEACRQSQEDFCLDLVPEDFSDRDGRACTDAVGAAYADGQLRGPELAIVLQLGGACERIVVGSRGQGESCGEPSDCDRSAGFDCVRKADAERGSCEIPEQTEAGRDCEAAQVTCEPGFYCNGQNCIEAKDPGGACTIQEQCGEEGYCNDQGKCEERLGVGDPCSANVECRTGICDEFGDERVCTDRVVLSRAEPICQDLK